MFLSLQNEVRSFFTNVHFKYQQNLPRKPSRLWANLEMCAQLSITVWNTSLHKNFWRRASIKHATWNDHYDNHISHQGNCIYWFIKYIVCRLEICWQAWISTLKYNEMPFLHFYRYDMTTEKVWKAFYSFRKFWA